MCRMCVCVIESVACLCAKSWVYMSVMWGLCVCVHALASLCVSASSVHTSKATNFSAARPEMWKRPLRT